MKLEELIAERARITDEIINRKKEIIKELFPSGKVRVKPWHGDASGKVGWLIVHDDFDRPLGEVKFFRFKKNGELSLNSTYVGHYGYFERNEVEFKSELMEFFEEVKE